MFYDHHLRNTFADLIQIKTYYFLPFNSASASVSGHRQLLVLTTAVFIQTELNRASNVIRGDQCGSVISHDYSCQTE
jgi:hypothetical protein